MTLVIPAAAHSDLDTMSDVELTIERDKLRLIAAKRDPNALASPTGFTSALEDEECERLVAIYNQLRRRSGKQPKAAAVKGGKSKASDADLMSL